MYMYNFDSLVERREKVKGKIQKIQKIQKVMKIIRLGGYPVGRESAGMGVSYYLSTQILYCMPVYSVVVCILIGRMYLSVGSYVYVYSYMCVIQFF